MFGDFICIVAALQVKEEKIDIIRSVRECTLEEHICAWPQAAKFNCLVPHSISLC